ARPSRAADPAPTTPLLELSGVHKRFGGVHALRGADLTISAPGVVHALIGQNGSGKSTLLGVLSGQLRPDEGGLALDGGKVAFASAASAIAHGVAMVSQETAVVPELSVAENVLLGRRSVRGPLGLDRRRTRRRALEVLARLSLDYDPDLPVGRLRPDQQQMVEIARALSMDARILVLDEPTSSLTDDEVEALFTAVRELTRQGVSVIYVSHRLSELFAVADELTVLRDGLTVAQGPMAGFDTDTVVQAMVGEARTGRVAAGRAHAPMEASTPAVAVRGLSVRGLLHDVDLEVGRGEIVGVAGLVGAGRSELLKAIFGVLAIDAGAVEVEGRPVSAGHPRSAIRQGLGFLPPDRKTEGVVLSMSVADNLGMVRTNSRARLAPPARAAEAALCTETCRTIRIRTPSIGAPVWTLSGGNQQKVALGKWLGTGIKALLLDEPTRGVDVGAKAEIHDRLRATAAAGTGLLVSSSEHDELLELCDRILVMSRGRIVASLDPARATDGELARLTGGHL
ncbi:MAG: ribose transport system ATP-binding protein, partial [Solirubrobacteraceae bacterium]|nr:ribose transport system ATP-binding protein [Solirubrobacteraceae bacterium]